MMRARRVAHAVIAFVALIAACTSTASGAPVAAQTGTARAVVIVDTGSGVHTTVVEFSGSISGLTALTLANADPVTISYGSLGQAVCQLYGVGDAPVPGECPGGWAYYRAVGGATGWTASGLGASNTAVHDGDVEGWKYGGGPPPFSSFCSVVGCAPPPTQPPATSPPLSPPPTPVPAGPAYGGAIGSTAPPGTSPVPAGGSASPTNDDTPSRGSAATGTTGGSAEPSAASSRSPSSATSTTRSTADKGVADRARSRKANIEVAAGPNTGGGDSGSPIGVIVAAVVLATAAAAAVWLRRRRQGPAPG